MALETSVILRSILIELRTARTLGDAIAKVEALCSKEDLDSVEHAMSRIEKGETNGN